MDIISNHQEPLFFSFDNSFIAALPADPLEDKSRRQVYNACYSRVKPTAVKEPRLVAASKETAALLDIAEHEMDSSLFMETFVGNRILQGMDPHAMNYGGHQFGNWAGQLGDGRAINLGEIINSQGERWALQLKGAGLTPYSRQADGLAVLRSSIREFLCSEAMLHLGVPTTRALSVIETGEDVLRDMFYDGHPQLEPGAVVCRVAPTFIRFGNFEIHSSKKEYDLLRRLADYTISTYFPHLGAPSPEVYAAWFLEICPKTVQMILEWMRVGYVHGVMNTDNMSILGLTIDYGPYGWLEVYESDWTPNTTDAHGHRYAFGNQPHIGQWNLVQLASALLPLVEKTAPLQAGLDLYKNEFLLGWNSMMASKIGISNFSAREDDQLIGDLIDLLQTVETDMTIFFRVLSTFRPASEGEHDLYTHFRDGYYSFESLPEDYCRTMNDWLRRCLLRRQQDDITDTIRTAKMNKTNPKYVLRNYLAQMAIDKAEAGDPSLVKKLLNLLKNPYDEQPGCEEYANRRPEWARNRPGCSMLSCSS